ncbi:putative ripening-related protein 5 [Oryza glaberrima]|uniref:putative ripening-related protein 5 n=1 Tax=Oryza glaberrima TaxID=4538 RepID=UPI00224C370E|nr:putative ripening-related protein 5 [Oryza glaberrima]
MQTIKLYNLICISNPIPSTKSKHKFIKKTESNKVAQLAKMASARAMAAMAMIFLLAALSTTHLASSLRPGAGGACRPSGYLPGKSGNCEKSNDPDCCEDGKAYPQYRCSPPVTAATGAVLTLNSFEKGKDGGGPSECDNAYHSDGELVVALSTGWFAGTARCGHRVRITASGGGGRSVVAKVVDECDSVHGCDGEHNYEAPCGNNIVDASPAVWDALGLDKNVGMEHITWSDTDE